MPKTPQEILASTEFHGLVRRRWTVSLGLTLVLFFVYYGYIVLIALDKPLMATKIGEATTLGIPLGIGVIVISWALTATYVAWANRVYDVQVKDLKDQVKR